MATKSAGAVIRSMYNFCQSKKVLTYESEQIMKEYFARIIRMRSGKGRKSKTAKI